MVKKIRNRLKNNDNKRLFENFISLSVLQGANYVLPLITLPYLVRVLGPEKFGLISFATVIVTYFQIITDYGFNFSASKDVSINRDNPKKIEEIFSSVMMLKITLAVTSFIILLISVHVFERLSREPLIYYISFGTVIGQLLFPVWLFQGMEKMKFITVINIVSKLIFSIAIFVFVRNENHYYIVPACNSLGFIIGGLISLVIVRYVLKIKFRFQNVAILYGYFKGGFHIFVSNISVSIYTISTTFILGILTNNTTVGIYTAGEKIIKAVQGLITPISQAIYPYISLKVKKSPLRSISIINKTALMLNSIIAILSILLLIFAKPLASLVLGGQYTDSVVIIRILSFTPLFVGISNIYAIIGLYNFDMQKIVSKFVLLSASLHIVISFILIHFLDYIGSAVALAFTELLIAICSWFFFKYYIEKKVTE